MQGRTGVQVKSRYEYSLDPSLKKGAFSEEEDKLILEEVQQRGRKWSEIAELEGPQVERDCRIVAGAHRCSSKEPLRV